MGVLLAVASALAWGSGDFVAGITSRRVSSLAIVVSSQAVGAVVLLALAPLAGGHADGASLAWGAAGGLGSGVGLALLYHGLATGPMSVVAPLTAVVAAIVPVAYGLVTGDPLSGGPLAGVALALGAVVLVSIPAAAPAPTAATGASATSTAPPAPPSRPPVRAVLVALGAGVGFGGFYVCFARAAADSGLWPVVSARTATVVVMGALALAAGTSPVVPAAVRAATVLVGLLDGAAQALYLLATRQDLLPVVSVIASLYPAVTVVLAGAVLREAISARQVGALLVAGVGVALIVLG